MSECVVERFAQVSQPSLDWRIRKLVGDKAWFELPVSVQRRFSKPACAGLPKLYRGRVIETRLSRAGWLLAQAARLIGAPIPLEDGACGPTSVSVVEDEQIGGQIWTRVYARPGRFPQVVHSAKRFRGPTGLEEYIGSGIGMELAVTVEDGALVFRSTRYVLLVEKWRLTIPSVLCPGRMEIVHSSRTADSFSFRLLVTHPWLGVVVRQEAHYTDA